MQQNSTCRLCGETINHIISECSKSVPKNIRLVLGNETHKVLWGFEVQIDHQISARRSDLIILIIIIIIRELAELSTLLSRQITEWNWKKVKRGKSTKPYLGIEKTVEHESDDYTNYNWCSWYGHQRIGTRTGRLGTNGTGRDCPNYRIVEIGQNTEKSPGDLKRLAVTQTPVRNSQLTLI